MQKILSCFSKNINIIAFVCLFVLAFVDQTIILIDRLTENNKSTLYASSILQTIVLC